MTLALIISAFLLGYGFYNILKIVYKENKLRMGIAKNIKKCETGWILMELKGFTDNEIDLFNMLLHELPCDTSRSEVTNYLVYLIETDYITKRKSFSND